MTDYKKQYIARVMRKKWETMVLEALGIFDVKGSMRNVLIKDFRALDGFAVDGDEKWRARLDRAIMRLDVPISENNSLYYICGLVRDKIQATAEMDQQGYNHDQS